VYDNEFDFINICGRLSSRRGHFDKQTMKSDTVGQWSFQVSTVIVPKRWQVLWRKAEKDEVASMCDGSHQNGLKWK